MPLIVHSDDPLNAETPPDLLAATPLTAAGDFYVRNHGDVPPARAGWTLVVDGLVENALTLTLDDLRELPRREVCATLQCAGNRRAGLLEVRDIPGEEPWGPGATGTATWSGVALDDVLNLAVPSAEASHVAFSGADWSEEASPPQRFGGSIPLVKARRSEVLLATEMNGAPLSGDHGAPLRTIVPGFIGARSVKWLTHVELRAEPSGNFFQDVAYRLLEPGQEPAAGLGIPLGEVALNSEILVPAAGAELPAGTTELRGYAFAGGERRVARVDVSCDGGARWQQAELLDDLGRWAWRPWRASIDLAAGEHELVVRAWDSAAAQQPSDVVALWNPKGYVNNAWGRVTVRTR